MSRYFGTDGIRGLVPEELNNEIAFHLGNALTTLKPKAKIVIGGDTRKSTDFLINAISAGAMIGGSDVANIGVVTTPKLSYITKVCGYDYGIMVSASHNESKYNGIKVFNNLGQKLYEIEKEKIEDWIFQGKVNSVNHHEIGCFIKESKTSCYEEFVLSFGNSLNNMKIAIDNSNGSAVNTSKKIFKKLNADLTVIADSPDGININEKCGSTHIEMLQKTVLACGAEVGFAFDGDADRVLAVDEKGRVIDGDMILYMLANHYKDENKLKNNIVVGTKQSNLGFENALKENGIEFLRSDVGDSYVVELMLNHNGSLGGESSGHIIMGDKMMTGDGVLTAVVISSILANCDRKISELVDFELYPNVSKNIKVTSKEQVFRQELVQNEIEKSAKEIQGVGRLVVRPSGTENRIRVLVECDNLEKAEEIADRLENIIQLTDCMISKS